MEHGYLKIKENSESQLIVEAKLVNSTLWMTKHEMADLLNVFVSTFDNNLRAIFKLGLLREENVTRIHKYENNGRQCEMILYNLEVLIFVSYRIKSLEAKVFREFIYKSLQRQLGHKEKPEILPFFISKSSLN